MSELNRDLTNDPDRAWQQWHPTERDPWTHRLAGHLLRRAGFGADRRELDQAFSDGPEKTLNRLFDLRPAESFDRQMRPLEQALTSSQEPARLSAWWLVRMAKTPCPLLEKMTLFWHGHFATGADKVQNSRAMLDQNRLLRRHALGSFGPLVHGISRDVAMLVYLDSTENRKTRPNENYARELMELFCLGPGNYTEQDIKELARCFTGWEVKNGAFRFNTHQHDTGRKTVLGREGAFGGDEAVDIVLDQPSAPRFLARKLIRFFVVDDLRLSDKLCQPIAEHLRDSDFDIASTVRRILGSRFFYSSTAVAGKVRSPVELGVGLQRALGASFSAAVLGDRLRELGQLPLFPPNVKGWNGGREWINASTFLGRANLVREMVQSDQTTFARGSLEKAVGAAQRSPEELVDDLLGRLVAAEVPKATRQALCELAGRRSDPHRRAVDVLSAIGALPEFQLA